MASGSHLSKELLDLVKSIGESRSKQEEDKIIVAEAQILKQKFLERNLNEKKMRELLIRALYVEMLGHDASFAYIHAVNLTQSKNLLVKRIGYLACSLFIDENSELLILMIATIQRDLQSKNHLEVLAALTVLGKLCNHHMLMAVNEAVQKLLTHTHEMIRKKAVMVVLKMFKTNPSSIDQIELKMKKALCDKDPQVMSVTLNYFSEQVKQRPADFKDLVNSFVVILKQIVEHRLPRDYDYHRIPAPWIQMKILEILSYLGADDKTASEQMFEIINQVLKRADDAGINIGYALVYQCLKTITMIYPSQSLMDGATTTISRFLSSESHNLKYMGITGLALIVKIDPKYTLNYQSLVVDCLEDADETLKIKTLELLFRMTNKQNVEAIVEKLLSYLRQAPSESSVRKDLVIKINSLCEQYSPNKNWYVRTMNKLYEIGGDLITADLSNKFITTISEYEKEIDGEKFRDATITIYLKILKKNSNIPDSLLQVIAWIMGEYGATLPDQKKQIKILDLLCEVAYRPLEDEMTRGYILTAITKLHNALDFIENKKIENLMIDYYSSIHVDVQQRAIEYNQIKNNGHRIKGLMQKIPLNEIQVQSQDFDFNLKFLDNFVQKELSQGKKEYDPQRRMFFSEAGMDIMPSGKELNFKPYQTPGIGSRVNADLQQSNPLYVQPVEKNANDSLQINNIKKVWGQAAAPQQTPQQQTQSFEPATLKTGSQGQNVETGIELQQTKLQKTQQQDQKKKEKANALFAGIGGTDDNKGGSSGDESDGKKKKKKKKNKADKEEKKEENINTLQTSTMTTNTSSNLMDLLDFDSAPIQQSNQNIGQTVMPTGGANLLDDIFGDKTTNSQMNMQQQQKHFQPVLINTQQFGEQWIQNGNEKKIMLTAPIITSPQVYANTMKNKLDIHPVEIINNEVICAGQSLSNGSLVLVHCRVNMGGQLEVTIKGSSNDSIELIGSKLLPQALTSMF